MATVNMMTVLQMKPIRRPSRTDVLYAALKEMAIKLGPDARLPTVDTLCSQLDVAKVTLDCALRRLESEQVLVRLPRRGIFVASTIAQKTIGVVFGSNIFGASFSPFWGLLLQEVRQQATERKHRFLAYLDIAQTSGGLGGHEQLIEDLENRRINGILFLCPSFGDESRQLGAYGVPLVVFGGAPPLWGVNHDKARLLSMAAGEMAKRRCQRVALLGMTQADDFQRLERDLREAGYLGQPVLDWSYSTWVSRIPESEDKTREAFGRALAEKMIAARATTPLPDGLVSLDDTMTRGVISALHQAGLQPGRDMYLATIANKGSPVLEPYASNLILMEYNPADSVRAALDMLEVLMNGGTPVQNPVMITPVLR